MAAVVVYLRMRKLWLFCVTLILLFGRVAAQTPTISKEALDSIQPIGAIFSDKDTFIYFTIVDTAFSKYTLPKKFTKPGKWLKADKQNKEWNWYGASYGDTFKLQMALDIIDKDSLLYHIGQAKSWCLKNYREVFPHLISRLAIKQKIGLVNTADLIIWDRIETGDLEFYGHGGSIDEDLFTIAGRASWILNDITGEEFAVVHANLTKQQALDFKIAWVKYIENLK